MAESHVVSALRQKRAAVTREVQGLERRLGELRAALVHLEGSMRLFAEEDRPAPADGPALPAPVSRLPSVMPRGDMTRLVLDALRGAVGGQSLSRITETVAAAIGMSVEDRKTLHVLSERVRNALYRLRDRNAKNRLQRQRPDRRRKQEVLTFHLNAHRAIPRGDGAILTGWHLTANQNVPRLFVLSDIGAFATEYWECGRAATWWAYTARQAARMCAMNLSTSSRR